MFPDRRNWHPDPCAPSGQILARGAINDFFLPGARVIISRMDVSRTAFGAWNGGRFMNFGEALPDERWIGLARHAYERGIRNFITADVYGSGAADELLARARGRLAAKSLLPGRRGRPSLL